MADEATMDVGDFLKQFFGRLFGAVPVNGVDPVQNAQAMGLADWVLPPDPIAIKIVREDPVVVVPRPGRSWSSDSMNVTTVNGMLLCGANSRRRGGVIRNFGPSDLRIGPTQSGLPTAGRFAAGDAIALDQVGDVWVGLVAGGTLAEIAVYQILEDGGNVS